MVTEKQMPADTGTVSIIKATGEIDGDANTGTGPRNNRPAVSAARRRRGQGPARGCQVLRRVDGRAASRTSDIQIVCGLLSIFAVLLVLVVARPTPLTHFDEWIRDVVQRRAHTLDDGRPLWIRRITDFGGTTPAIPVLAAVAAVAAMVRRSWRPVLAALASYAVLGGAVVGLKIAVGRPGPGRTSLPATLGYFPSGHTANTLMCYGTCALIVAAGLGTSPGGRRARVGMAAAMVLFALAVGFSLVWLDYHWASDVLGSYALCGAALFGIARVVHVDRGSRNSPGSRDSRDSRGPRPGSAS